MKLLRQRSHTQPVKVGSCSGKEVVVTMCLYFQEVLRWQLSCSAKEKCCSGNEVAVSNKCCSGNHSTWAMRICSGNEVEMAMFTEVRHIIPITFLLYLSPSHNPPSLSFSRSLSLSLSPPRAIKVFPLSKMFKR